MEERLEERWRGHRREHRMLAKFIKITAASQDIRLDGMNEFRKTVEDVVKTSVSRQEWEAGHSALTRLVYIGVGIILAVSALLTWILSKR